MLAYYINLALRSLRRNLMLTALMILAIALGIGACMTTLTVFRAMSGDPIPQKSSQLYAVQIDNRGPSDPYKLNDDNLEDQLEFLDASALMRERGAPRQTALYLTRLPLRPADLKLKPSKQFVRVAYSDFFPMFEVPFKFGGPWTAADDARRSPVVVISNEMNDKLFGGRNSIGNVVNLGDESYTVIGVLKEWLPIPHFYDLNVSPFAMREEFYVPFTRAIDKHYGSLGHVSCGSEPKPGWDGFMQSDCTWIQFWVELPAKSDVDRYRVFLNNYASEQQRAGRFHWPPNTKLRDVMQWLSYRHVVPNEVNILLLVSVGFLLVCLLNAMGLMLARISHRAPDIGVRRARGASRGAVFAT